MYKLKKGDCLKIMPTLLDESVDLVVCDLPYGILDCDWDKKLPLAELWAHWKRLLRPRGAVVLFGQQPFSTELINSNRGWFRYELIWEKSKAGGFLLANKMPLRAHENILVFYPHLPVYNPQKSPGKPYSTKSHGAYAGFAGKGRTPTVNKTGERHPRSVLKFPNPARTVHPTQKPLELCEFLVRTYTNEGATVLDNCMGSGQTGVACLNSGRSFIGIELNPEFYSIAAGRIYGAIRASHCVAAYQRRAAA